MRSFLQICLCLSLLLGCKGRQPLYVGGIQVNEANQDDWVKKLDTHGLNTVSLTVYAYQGDWDGTKLRFKESNPGIIEELRAAKRQGLRTVLIVRMGLDSAYPRNEFLWHGMILPTEDKPLNEWFENYGAFALKWAKIAEEEGVDIFGIGSELTAMTSTLPVQKIPELEAYHISKEAEERELKELKESGGTLVSHEIASSMKNYSSSTEFFRAKKAALRSWALKTTFEGQEDRVFAINNHRQKLDTRWRKLIKDIRKTFRGKLTYAAGFDQYQAVGFWDALDFIGINAYFKLREPGSKPKSEEELATLLEKSWQGVLAEISAFRNEQKVTTKPVLFTEIGYTFRENSTVYPWASDSFDLVGDGEEQTVYVWSKQPENFIERLLALRTLRKSLQKYDRKFFAGLLYWKFSTHDYHEDDEPFVHILGSDKDADFTKELARFVNE